MPGLAHLDHRALVSLKGRDTFKYLQALTTNNLSTPSSQFTSFLNAQGRILYDAFIYRTGESECLVEVDASTVDGFLAHLKRYKLRSKFDMRMLTQDELKVYSVFKLSQGHPSLSIPTSTVHQLDQRAPGFGYRILSSSTPLEMPETTVAEYTQSRFLNAIAEGSEELIPEKALPQESNIDYMHGLDFHKGCYIGQELTVRTHHTGVVRKRIVPIRLFPSAELLPNLVSDNLENATEEVKKWIPQERCEIVAQVDGGLKARPSGRLLASIGTVGIALCRLEKIGLGSITREGEKLSVMPYRPKHWPQ